MKPVMMIPSALSRVLCSVCLIAGALVTPALCGQVRFAAAADADDELPGERAFNSCKRLPATKRSSRSRSSPTPT